MHPLKVLTASLWISESPAERSPTANLDTVSNELDDTTHARLDKDVLDVAGRAPSEAVLNVSSGEVADLVLTSLLTIIISKSEGHLDPQYEETPDAKALIEEHPELKGKLKEAWKAGTFKEIRNLSAIHQ